MSRVGNVSTPDCKIMFRFELSFKKHVAEEVQAIEDILKDVIGNVCKEHTYHITKLDVLDGGIILEMNISEFVTPIDVVRNIKSKTLIGIMKECPSIKKMYGKKGTIWNEGYLIKNIG